MLYEFLIAKRDEILGDSRQKIARRHIPVPTLAEMTEGLPLFLDQLTAILGLGKDDRADGHLNLSVAAASHGGELQRIGLTVAQVVQDYGSICQSVTELADQHHLAITAEEFQTFNCCLDEAIAQAVTEFEHQRDQTAQGSAGEQLDFLVHEMRNLLMTSILTFDALSRGNVGVHGSTGKLLGGSLRRMRALIDRTLLETRLAGGKERTERVQIAALIEEVEVAATIEAGESDIKLSVVAAAPDVFVVGDRQILTSVVATLVQNAFKFTRPGGHVQLRVQTAGERVQIEVQDECGGLPPGKVEELFQPREQRGSDKAGLGFGLSICQKGTRAMGGELRARDVPGSGCVFTVSLPRGRSA